MDTRIGLVRALALFGALALAAGCSNGRRGGGVLPRDAGETDAGVVPPPRDAGTLPGVDAGPRPPGTDAGRPPGTDAGVVGTCSNVTGSYNVTGDCEVTACSVAQSGCSVTATCDGPIGTLTGSISGTTAMLASPFGTCLVEVDPGSGWLSGTCVAGSSVCGFDAMPL